MFPAIRRARYGISRFGQCNNFAVQRFIALLLLTLPITAIAGPKIGEDIYEPDNSHLQAIINQYLLSATTHNFHDTGNPLAPDEDWLYFWMPSNTWVLIINTFGVGINCDPTIEMYRLDSNDELVLVTTLNNPGVEYQEAYVFEAGDYYLRVTNSLGLSGDGTDYKIAITGFDAGTGILGALSGIVRSSADDSIIPNATIKIEQYGALNSSTDNSGVYNFAAIPKQTYTVTATAPNYIQDAVIVDLSTGINTQDFFLDPVPQAILNVSPSERAMGEDGGSVEFDITNTGNAVLSWTASVATGSEWLTITSTTSGTDAATLVVEAVSNPTEAERVGTIEVADPDAAGSPVTVTVRQAPDSTPTLGINPTTHNVGSGSGQITSTVSNAGAGALTFGAAVTSGADWLVLAKGTGGGTVTANYAANNTEVARIGVITVTATGATQSPQDIVITQAANTTPTLAVAPASRSVGAQSGNTTFTVSNAGFGTLTWSASVTSGNTWLSASTSKASGGGTILAQFSANPTGAARIGKLTVTAPGALNNPIEVTVTQAANTTPVLSVSPTNRVLGADAAITSFDIANAGFGTLTWDATIDVNSSWISFVNKLNGSGAATVELVVAQNLTTEARIGTITVTASGAANSPQVVTIEQAAAQSPALEVQPRSKSVGATAGSTTYAISNAGSGTLTWSADVFSGGDWIAVSAKADGTGNGTINVQYDENAGESARLAIVRISAPGAAGSPIDVNLIQSAKEQIAEDLNGDDAINAVDVQIIVNAALGFGGNNNADVDGDGDVDAVDVQLVINAALGL